MDGHVYVVQGDITRCQADAIAVSSSTRIRGTGKLFSAFGKLDGFTAAYAGLRDGDWRVGDAAWLPGTAQRPPIVVGFAIEDHAHDAAGQAAATVRSVLRCAVDHLRAEQPTKRLLVLLPAFLVGDGGARDEAAELARVQVAAAIGALRELPGVDAAFVLFEPADHALFRDARRAIAPEHVAVEPRLVEAVRRRECVLFVGSGVSAGAGMHGWARLIEELRGSIADLTPTPSRTAAEHLAIAQRYRDHAAARGLPPLREVVRTLFGRANATQPTLLHYLLASLETRNVITTNYDHLIEHTLEATRTPLHRVTEASHVPATSALDRVNVVKLHGDAEDGADVIASQRDYDEFFERWPAFDLLLSGLLLNQTFLFVGYSLQDPNFLQIHGRIVRMLGAACRPAFVTTFATAAHDPENVEVVRFAGDLAEQTAALWRWTDALVDAAIRPDSTLLADRVSDESISPALAEMRECLLDVASELLRATQQRLVPDDARVLARIAAMLFEHGWRAPQGNHRLLVTLARQLGDPAERRALLVEALAHTDSSQAAADVRVELRRALDRSP